MIHQPHIIINAHWRSSIRWLMMVGLVLTITAACSQNNTHAADKYRSGDNILRQKDPKTATDWQRIIVRLDVKDLASIQQQAAEAKDPAKARALDLEMAQRIREVADKVMSRIEPAGAKLFRRYDALPLLGLHVSPKARALLESMPEVLAIEADRRKSPTR